MEEPGDLSWLIPIKGRGKFLLAGQITGDFSWLDKLARESAERECKSNNLRFNSGLLLRLDSGVDRPLPLTSPVKALHISEYSVLQEFVHIFQFSHAQNPVYSNIISNYLSAQTRSSYYIILTN